MINMHKNNNNRNNNNNNSPNNNSPNNICLKKKKINPEDQAEETEDKLPTTLMIQNNSKLMMPSWPKIPINL